MFFQKLHRDDVDGPRHGEKHTYIGKFSENSKFSRLREKNLKFSLLRDEKSGEMAKIEFIVLEKVVHLHCKQTNKSLKPQKSS